MKWIICTEYKQNRSSSKIFTEHLIYIKKGDINIKQEIEMNRNNFIIFKHQFNHILLECIEDSEKYSKPEEIVKYNIKIKNNRINQEKIFLEIINPSNWLTYLNSTYIFLLPNEEKTITLSILPPENGLYGNSAIIYVKGTSGSEPLIKNSVLTITIIKRVSKVSIFSNQTEYNLNPAQTLNLNFSLQNLGNGVDTYAISINNTASKYIDNWGIDPQELIKNLEISKIDYLNFKITPPESAIANSYAEIVFDVKSLSNENLTLDRITIKIIINQIHNIQLVAETTQQSAKPGEIVEIAIDVINNGNGEETVTFGLSGENSNWGYLDLELPFLTLGIDKTEDINLIIFIPHDTTPDEKAEIELSAFVGDELFSIIAITSVEQIHDLSLECDSTEEKINPGESVFYHFKVFNNGNADDNFTFRVNLSKSNIPENWLIEPNNVNYIVNNTESINIPVKVTSHIKAKAEEKVEFIIEIISSDDEVQDSIKITSLVNHVYEILIEIDKNEQDVEPEQKVEYKINLRNSGNGNDSVRLEISGQNSNWGYLSESIITLDSDETKIITLTVSAPKLTINGDTSRINIQAISKNGEASNILTTTTTVKIPENIEPIADFKIIFKNKEISKIRIGETFSLDASGSSDEEGNVVEYQWDFDNGVIKYGEKINYTYPDDTKIKKYTITLRVKDSNGATTEKQMTIEVLEGKEEGNSILYLILAVIVIIGLIIVVMLLKMLNTLKRLREEEKLIMPTTEKIGVGSSDSEERNDMQKRRENEMWKPHKHGNEVSELQDINRIAKEENKEVEIIHSEQSKVINEGVTLDPNSETAKVDKNEKSEPFDLSNKEEETIAVDEIKDTPKEIMEEKIQNVEKNSNKLDEHQKTEEINEAPKYEENLENKKIEKKQKENKKEEDNFWENWMEE